MEILVILIIIYALKKAKEDTGNAWRKSRGAYMKSAAARYPGMSRGRQAASAARHDLGWAGSQAGHGFPQARHGFMTGWHEGRQAHDQALAGRHKAKAERMEARAGLAPQLRDYRNRQRKALEQIRAGRRPDAEPAVPGEPAPAVPAGEAVPEGAASPDADGWSYGKKGAPYAWPIDDPEAARRYARVMSQDGSTWQVHHYPVKGEPGVLDTAYENGERVPGTERATRRADGQPETEADTRFFDLRESGYAGPIDQDGNIPDPADPKVAAPDGPGRDTAIVTENGEPVTGEGAPEGSEEAAGNTSPDPAPSISTEGNDDMATAAADTTYDQVLTSMTRNRDQAEVATAEQQRAYTEANATAEAAQGLEVDQSTLSALADHLDAQQAALTAHQRVQETADAVVATLQRGHAGLAEAHQNAPVEAAHKQFYAD